MKNVSRRRMMALATASGAVASAQQPLAMPLGSDRMGILQPLLDRRQAALKTLREFAVADRVEPTQGLQEP